MKAFKVILTILLTLLLVVIGFATEIITIANLTVMNPSFYKTTLRRIGLYENVHTLLVDKLEGFIHQQEVIPEDSKQQAYEIVINALPQKKFEKQIADFIGDSVDFILYDNRQGEIPIQQWIDDLVSEIKVSDLVAENEDMDRILTVTLTDYLQRFNIGAKESIKISDVFYKVLAPTQKIKEKLDNVMWGYRYWFKWINVGTYIGLAALLVILGMLFIIWHKNVGIVFKITGVLLIINSITIILTGASMFALVSISKILGFFPEFLVIYTSIIQSIINPLALITLIIGIVVLIIGIIILIVGSAISKKSKDKNIVHIEVNNQIVTESIPDENSIPLADKSNKTKSDIDAVDTTVDKSEEKE